jgi:hypothetical protein
MPHSQLWIVRLKLKWKLHQPFRRDIPFIYEIWWVKNIPLLLLIALLVYLWVLCYSYFYQYCWVDNALYVRHHSHWCKQSWEIEIIVHIPTFTISYGSTDLSPKSDSYPKDLKLLYWAYVALWFHQFLDFPGVLRPNQVRNKFYYTLIWWADLDLVSRFGKWMTCLCSAIWV